MGRRVQQGGRGGRHLDSCCPTTCPCYHAQPPLCTGAACYGNEKDYSSRKANGRPRAGRKWARGGSFFPSPYTPTAALPGWVPGYAFESAAASAASPSPLKKRSCAFISFHGQPSLIRSNSHFPGVGARAPCPAAPVRSSLLASFVSHGHAPHPPGPPSRGPQ